MIGPQPKFFAFRAFGFFGFRFAHGFAAWGRV
jgi:hypothetical protein